MMRFKLTEFAFSVYQRDNRNVSCLPELFRNTDLNLNFFSIHRNALRNFVAKIMLDLDKK